MHEDRKPERVHASGQGGVGHGAPWLIAAVTGRALAASAARGGHRVVVLDYFADRDSALHSVECRVVALPTALRFDRGRLLESAAQLAPAHTSPGLVYGSGFENRTGLLRDLASGRRLFGNRPDVVRAVKDPKRLFPLLTHLGIEYPETRLALPPRPSGWLAKRAGSAGGTGVRLARESSHRAGTYYQRLERGRVLSALFLANGRRAAVLGFNRQWTATVRPELPFQFGGAVGSVNLPRGVARQVSAGLDRLVAATGLVGLNGLDFILADGRWSVLEVNPRPTATVELYDPDYPQGLFDWHLRACAGELPDRVPMTRAARALAVVHAAEPWESPEVLTLPGWCRDLPRPGLSLSPGDPVCTVHAAAANPRAALQLLDLRRDRLQAHLHQPTSPVTV